MESCYNALFAVGEAVFSAFAVYLGVAPDFFASVSQNTYSNMRVLHYPPKEAVQAQTDIGVHAHEDQGLITLLLQDDNGGPRSSALRATGCRWCQRIARSS